MKKIIKVCIILLSLFLLFPKIDRVYAVEADEITPNASASILIEASSKEVIASKNEHEKLYPASTTKIMTMILLFEELNKGTIEWDEILTTSAYAASMGGSQIFLGENEQMSVNDLFKSIAIASANDACVVVAERIGGTNQNFVSMMNEKAKELGLSNTNFVNCTGLHDDNHYTSAYDLSMMAAYLIEIGGEELLSVTSTFEDYIRQDTEESFWLVNTNKLLNSYQGIDGLKTGFTKNSGYCIVATASRDNLRFISVVLNEPDPKTRNAEAASLLDYGFNQFDAHVVFNKLEEVTKIKITNSKEGEVSVVARSDIIIPLKKGSEFNENYEIDIIKDIAPIKANEVVGYLILKDSEGKETARYELIVEKDVNPFTFFELLEQTYRSVLN